MGVSPNSIYLVSPTKRKMESLSQMEFHPLPQFHFAGSGDWKTCSMVRKLGMPVLDVQQRLSSLGQGSHSQNYRWWFSNSLPIEWIGQTSNRFFLIYHQHGLPKKDPCGPCRTSAVGPKRWPILANERRRPSGLPPQTTQFARGRSHPTQIWHPPPLRNIPAPSTLPNESFSCRTPG